MENISDIHTGVCICLMCMYTTYITFTTIQIFYPRHFRKGCLWSPQFMKMAESNCDPVWVALTRTQCLPLPKGHFQEKVLWVEKRGESSG